jgi:two-component system, cell cycle sensor histidine kinase and response regulator CckA
MSGKVPPQNAGNQQSITLAESEEQYRLLFEKNPQPMWIYDSETLAYLAVNEAAIRQYGYSREEFLNMTLRDIRPPEDIELLNQVVSQLRPELSYAGHWRHLKKDGTIIDVEIISHELFFNGSRARLTQAKDVTEQKKAEASLRQSEERFSQIFHASPVAISITTIKEGRFVDVNEEYLKLFGSTREEVLGHTAFELGIWFHNDDRNRLLRILKEGGKVRNEVFRVRNRSGEVIDVLSSAEAINLQGEDCLLILSQNITERLRAEKVLRQSQSSLANAQRIAHLGNCDWDIANDFVAFSDEMYSIFGISRNEFGGAFMDLLGLFLPEDLPKIQNAIDDALAGVQPLDIEHRIIRPDGKERYLHILAEVITNRQGKPVSLSGTIQDITERKLAEVALQRSEERYRIVAKVTNDVIWDWDLVTNQVLWNDGLYEVFKYQPGEVVEDSDWWAARIHPADREQILNSVEALFDSGDLNWASEYRFQKADGSYATVFDRGYVAKDEQGKPVRMIGTMLDLTERRSSEKALRESEEKLQQAQKMESIGRLAGGIAHDFNNLLTAILGYSEITLLHIAEGDPLRANLEEIKRAGNRAANLTRQLLAFSRKQVLQPQIMDFNSIIFELDKMLRRLIGEDIELVTHLQEPLGMVKADPSQIEQVIINLVINARDAMPEGGKLTIETANLMLDQEYTSKHPEVKPGAYVMIAVSDNGEGMDEATKERIFEPFFTTKAIGKGTGLGLSTVHGIVNQSEGHIWVYSELGNGSTFKLYFPRTDLDTTRADASTQNKRSFIGGNEIILLVEDDEIVRNMAKRILELDGYQILTASTPFDALAICQEYKEKIHLLLTDVVMPQMSGNILAKQILAIRPDIIVLYMSGYTENTIVHHGALDEGINFIEKPFTPENLSHRVRALLDKANPS